MNGREFVMLFGFGAGLLVFVTLVFNALMARRKRRDESDRQRLAVIERSLQDPTIDAATRAEVLRALARDHSSVHGLLWRALTSLTFWRVLWFGSGWFLFVIGGCMLAAEGMDITRGVEAEIVLPMALVGFAMLTLPAALRELTRRSAAPAGR